MSTSFKLIMVNMYIRVMNGIHNIDDNIDFLLGWDCIEKVSLLLLVDLLWIYFFEYICINWYYYNQISNE